MQIKSVLNGKEINLTGDNATIKSNNFNVDKDGNMTCKKAKYECPTVRMMQAKKVTDTSMYVPYVLDHWY